jgi:hypothetical protein
MRHAKFIALDQRIISLGFFKIGGRIDRLREQGQSNASRMGPTGQDKDQETSRQADLANFAHDVAPLSAYAAALLIHLGNAIVGNVYGAGRLKPGHTETTTTNLSALPSFCARDCLNLAE